MKDSKGVIGRAGGDARAVETGPPRPRGLDVRFASGTDAAVSRRLKEMYDGLVSEPVPDRFLDLLDQLEEIEKPAGTPGPAPDAGAAGGVPADTPTTGPVPGDKP
jgi:hypothetical protein